MRKIIFFLFVSSWALLAQTNQGPIKVKSVTFADTSVQSSAGLPANGATSTGSGVANVVTFPGTVAAGMMVQRRDVCYYMTGTTCGDGVHDDTATINAAFSALAATGGTLVFPSGIFLTSTGITPSQTSPYCVNVEGAGSSATTIRAVAAMNGVWWRPGLVSLGTVDQMKCSVKGISFDGNNLALTAMNNAGWPRGKYEDLTFLNAVPNTTDNTNAQFIVGENVSLGLANGQGDDYEAEFEHIHVLAPNASATGPYQMLAKQTVTDGTANDIVILGFTGGTSGSPNTALQDGLFTYGGGRNWDHVHCYPSSQYAPFPTCIYDGGAGHNIFNNTEIDGMTGDAIIFGGTNSIARDTWFIYGGTGNPASTYTSSYGFKSLLANQTNTARGGECEAYGGAVTTSWLLVDPASQPIQYYGPNACPSSTVVWTTYPATFPTPPTYSLPNYTANTYVKLGTWVAGGQGDQLSIRFKGGSGYASGSNSQSSTQFSTEIGNYSAGNNLTGLSSTAIGNSSIVQVIAIGTGNTNAVSWDIWAFVSAYSPTSYVVEMSVGTGAVWTDFHTTTQITAPTGTYLSSVYTSILPLSPSAVVATLTTTAATTNTLTVTGMTASGHCDLTATNAAAAANIATTYVSAKATNQITVTHTAIAAMTYDAVCTPY